MDNIEDKKLRNALNTVFSLEPEQQKKMQGNIMEAIGGKKGGGADVALKDLIEHEIIFGMPTELKEAKLNWNCFEEGLFSLQINAQRFIVAEETLLGYKLGKYRFDDPKKLNRFVVNTCKKYYNEFSFYWKKSNAQRLKEPATDKQKDLIKSLLCGKNIMFSLTEITKGEASSAIQALIAHNAYRRSIGSL